MSRELWNAVLVRQCIDLVSVIPIERVPAEQWVGRRPSPDFIEVCSLAGQDYEAVWEKLNRIRNAPESVKDEVYERLSASEDTRETNRKAAANRMAREAAE